MGGSGDVVGSWVPSQLVHHLLGKPSQPLGSPPICTRPQTPPAAVLCTALQCSILQAQDSSVLELCLFLSVGPRRGVTVWGNHSLSPSHTFSLFLSPKGLFLRPALPAWESLELQCVRFHRLGLNHSVCHHPAISNILLFSQQCSDSLTVCFPFGFGGQLNKSSVTHTTMARNHTTEIKSKIQLEDQKVKSLPFYSISNAASPVPTPPNPPLSSC